MNMENLIAVSNKLVEVNNKLTEVIKQRDTLAEALIEMLDYAHDCRLCTVQKAQEALAAVKGENQ
jgi:hypothetical protein